jgi:hypothetical protein
VAEECDVCGEPMQPALSPRAEGAFVDVAVELEPFAVLACPRGHERRYPYSGWSNDLRDATLDALPAARYDAFQGLQCRACGGALDRHALSPGELRIAVPLPHGEPVQATVRLPVLRCPVCGTDQTLLTDDVRADLFDSLDAALESAAVEP